MEYIYNISIHIYIRLISQYMCNTSQ